MRVLVTRPEPAASATAAALAGHGHQALLAPLLATAPRLWVAPATAPKALLVTSANAVRHGGEGLLAYRSLPVFAVGPATAAALRAAGFGDVRDGGGDVAARRIRRFLLDGAIVRVVAPELGAATARLVA